MKTILKTLRLSVPKTAACLALGMALIVGMSGMAHADWHRDRGHDHHDRWHGRPEHVYAPPVVYSPPPEQSPGLNLILPLHFH